MTCFLYSCILLALYGLARCCDKRISSLTPKRTNSLRVERLQRGINTNFCSNPVQSNHSGNESLINRCVIGSLPFSMGKPVAPRFWQTVRKIQDWYISPRNRVYHLYESVPFIRKQRRRPETGIKDGFEAMEHEFAFEIFRPEKQDYLFRCSLTPGNFPLERGPKKSSSIYFSTEFSGIFFLNGR